MKNICQVNWFSVNRIVTVGLHHGLSISAFHKSWASCVHGNQIFNLDILKCEVAVSCLGSLCTSGLAVLLVHSGAGWFNLWPPHIPPTSSGLDQAPLHCVLISWFHLGNIDWGFPMRGFFFLQGWGLQPHPASWRIMVPLFVCNLVKTCGISNFTSS